LRYAAFPKEEPRTPTTGVRATAQIRAFESKGKLAIVNPQRRMGCAGNVEAGFSRADFVVFRGEQMLPP
jgi:hypothetical protein